jgi:hypothetical protein
LRGHLKTISAGTIFKGRKFVTFEIFVIIVFEKGSRDTQVGSGTHAAR